jgi:hypothetical protein
LWGYCERCYYSTRSWNDVIMTSCYDVDIKELLSLIVEWHCYERSFSTSGLHPSLCLFSKKEEVSIIMSRVRGGKGTDSVVG